MDPFIGEIRMFGGAYPPRDWAFCSGQILAVNQNQALFSLINNAFGGDGFTSFALPDMRGRVPIHRGKGPGLTNRSIGEKFGQDRVTLTVNEMPSHSHQLRASKEQADSLSPTGQSFATPPNGVNMYSNETALPTTPLAPETVGAAGHSQAHYNLMPYSCISFIIALKGVYPSRS